ncbi:MAG TPA: hypothetical protein VE669_03330 [Actinomycetota bacterium]|nr:hypothetical protein [Actinomycetota bacterium]
MTQVECETAASQQPGHDFDRLFREESAGVFRTLYAYTGGRWPVPLEEDVGVLPSDPGHYRLTVIGHWDRAGSSSRS